MSTNPRSELREAIEAHVAALTRMHDAEVTLAKAGAMHCQLMARRADAFQNLDDQIALARAANLKRALDSDEDTRLSTLEAPAGFAAALVAREDLDEQIQGVKDSLPVLESELEEARRAAERAEYNLDCARERVFVAEATETAQEFMRALMELRQMSLKLRFMAVRQVRRSPDARDSTGGPFYGSGPNRPLTMPLAVNNAIHEEVMGDYDRRGGIKLRDETANKVTAWWAALRTNPDAEFEAGSSTINAPSPFDAAAFALRPEDAEL